MSEMSSGLLMKILNSKFQGLSGDIALVDQQLQPFQKAYALDEGIYGNLVRQVYSQMLDGAAGDTEIIVNRSQIVSFTSPYTESGLGTVIPIKYEKRSNLLLIFEPFSSDVLLLLLYIALFVIAILVRISGVPFAQQVATICRIPLMLLSACSPFHQTLLDDNRQFTIVDANNLVKNGDFVGYRKGSFIEIVLEELNFDPTQLKVFDSPRQYCEALENGSQINGVALVFDEIPNMKLLLVLEKYCSKYRRVGPIYRMKAVGFVVPRGSLLVPDVSQEISSVVEGRKIVQIETKWLGTKRTCPEPFKNISYSLWVDKMKGMYVIISLFIFSSFILFMLAHVNKESGYYFWRQLGYIFEVNKNMLTLIVLQAETNIDPPAYPLNMSEPPPRRVVAKAKKQLVIKRIQFPVKESKQ
ncbi:hypothetical protein AQUCO_00100721v1 [Aquilegia coerulea]|uniref:Ionotropic glutamate receptor C-terminal domain-containing protein n=1 Tax=Aquilegia coerulea TaxID=218851 RepID=A0A2G5FBM3_AQUCA|nr:hypothetical protein AQUCO_00100721v1 [Aquilegia coerulea]